MPSGFYKRTDKHKKILAKRAIGNSNYGMRGKNHTEETKRKIKETKRGEHHTEETKKKIKESTSGEKNHNWKGGITPELKKIRNSIEFRLWREAVFARDNWVCQKCQKRDGGILHPHHIQNFAQYPELRFAIDNGITFCEKCHKEFHKIYGRKNNTKEQLLEYLN